MAYPVRYAVMLENGGLFFRKKIPIVIDTLHGNIVCKCCTTVNDACHIANLLNTNEGYMIRPIRSREEALDSATHRHYKGGLYRLIGFGKHTENGEDMVLYEHLWPHKRAMWVRPKAIWDSPVEGTCAVRFNPLVNIVKGIWNDDEHDV